MHLWYQGQMVLDNQKPQSYLGKPVRRELDQINTAFSRIILLIRNEE